MSAAECIDQGKAAQTRKDYRQAIQLFSKALSLSKRSTESQLIALDHRCQTYAKTGKYDQALRDARDMIHQSKRQAPEGFLRCSQIERLSGNHQAAIKWLEHGINNVPKQERVFRDQLQKVRAWEKQQTIRQKRQDPFILMPLEIVELILSFFQYHEVVALLRVSKQWHRLFSRMRLLTTTIDFSAARGRVSYQAWNAAKQRLCHRPQNIILASLSSSATKAAQSWFAKYTNLECLEVLHLSDSEVCISNIRFEKLSKIRSLRIGKQQKVPFGKGFGLFATSSLLADVALHDIVAEDPIPSEVIPSTQLQHLQYRGIDFVLPSQHLDNYLCLQTISLSGALISGSCLDLKGHQFLRKLHLKLPSHQLAIRLSLPCSLEELTCAVEEHDSLPLSCAIDEAVNVPKLYKIRLEGNWVPQIINAIENSSNFPQFECVHLDNLPRQFWRSLYQQEYKTMQSCRKLVVASEELSDSDCDAFAKCFPSIEMLTLDVPTITGVFIVDLVQKSGCQLGRIALKNCYKVSHDIGTWLKNKGIDFEIVRTSSESKGLRHVWDRW